MFLWQKFRCFYTHSRITYKVVSFGDSFVNSIVGRMNPFRLNCTCIQPITMCHLVPFLSLCCWSADVYAKWIIELDTCLIFNSPSSKTTQTFLDAPKYVHIHTYTYISTLSIALILKLVSLGSWCNHPCDTHLALTSRSDCSTSNIIPNMQIFWQMQYLSTEHHFDKGWPTQHIYSNFRANIIGIALFPFIYSLRSSQPFDHDWSRCTRCRLPISPHPNTVSSVVRRPHSNQMWWCVPYVVPVRYEQR